MFKDHKILSKSQKHLIWNLSGVNFSYMIDYIKTMGFCQYMNAHFSHFAYFKISKIKLNSQTTMVISKRSDKSVILVIRNIRKDKFDLIILF